MKLLKTILFLAPITYVVFLAVEGRMPWQSNHSRFAPYRLPLVARPDLGRAITFYEKKISSITPTGLDTAALASLYLQQARLSGDTSWYDQAEKMAQRSLGILPVSNESAQMILAEVAGARHDFPKAITLSQNILGKKRDQGPLGILVTCYLAQGDLEKASIYADQLVDMKAAMMPLALRAVVLSAQGRDEEALRDFQRALTYEELAGVEESAWVRAMLGRYYFRRGQYREAEDVLKESVRIVPRFHLPLYLLGEMDFRRGRFAEAEGSFLEAFTSSKQVLYLRRYAETKAKLGQREKARPLLAQAQRLVRQDVQSGGFGHRLDLAQLLLDEEVLDSAQEALKLAEEEIKVRRSAEALSVMARALVATKQLPEAREMMQRVLRTGTKDPEYLAQLAAIESQMGNEPQAKFYYQLALRRDDSLQAAQLVKPVGLVDKLKAVAAGLRP